MLTQASVFSCLFMQLMITCCSRVRSAPFVTLAICRAFWNSTAFTSHTWCHSHSPVLVLPSGRGHFPMMEAGGSPFLHNNGASIDGDMTVAASTVVSSACCSDTTGGSTVWGPTSMGSASWDSIISPDGTSGMPVSQCHHFLDVLLSKCSAMSESVVDFHLCHSHMAETSLCFPLLFPSFRRWCSLYST